MPGSEVRSIISRRRLAVLFGGGLAVGAAACAAPPASPTAPPATSKAPAPPPAGAATAPATSPAAAPKPSPAATAAPKVAKPPQAWRFGSPGPQFYQAFFNIAAEKGLGREFGLDFQPANLTGGTQILKSVVAGELESASIGTSSVIAAVAEGADIIGVGSMFVKVPHVIAARGNVNQVTDLVGKSFAIVQPGDFSHALMLAILDKHQIPPDKLTWVSITGGGEAARTQALLAGKIDAGAITPEFLPQLRQDPQIKIFDVSQEIPDYVRQLIMVRGADVRERPELVQAFVTTMLRAARYALDNRQETLQLAAKIVGEAPESLNETFDLHTQGLVQTDLLVTPQQMAFMQDLNVKLDVQKTSVPVEKLLVTRFQQEAIKQLGPYKRSG